MLGRFEIKRAYLKEFEVHRPTKKEFSDSGHATNVTGERSETRLFNYFFTAPDFTWLQDVKAAPQCQAGYDFTLTLNTEHPLFSFIEAKQLYVDAKSSVSGILKYFSEHAKKNRCLNADTLIQQRKIIVISSRIDLPQQEIDVQLVLQLLSVAHALGDTERQKAIVATLSDRLQNAFEAEVSLIYKYLEIYLRTL